MPHVEPVARRMYDLIEPIGLVPYITEEPNAALLALGLGGYWDTYFAGRAAPFGRDAPAELVHAAFYNFAEGEVARHIPAVWQVTTPDAALAARERGCVAGLRGVVGDLTDDPAITRAADLLTRAATTAPVAGRPLYAALRSVPVPQEPVARLWHAATLLREHRGDGHVVTLTAEQITGTQAHLLQARYLGVADDMYGRAHHLPDAIRQAALDGLRERGLLDATGAITEAGRATRERIEALTDRLAEPPYDALSAAEIDQLAADLAPVSSALRVTLPW